MNNESTTPEDPISDATRAAAFRVAAEWLRNAQRAYVPDPLLQGYSDVALFNEADRLDAAARTPEQVAWDTWSEPFRDGETSREHMNQVVAATIAHIVGPDRVLTNRDDLECAVSLLYRGRHMVIANRLYTALRRRG